MGLTSLLPLVILFAVVGGAAYFGYQIYLWSNELADRGQKHMEKKNMTFTKDGGLKVGVKQMGAEEYADRTQRLVEILFGWGGGRAILMRCLRLATHAGPDLVFAVALGARRHN